MGIREAQKSLSYFLIILSLINSSSITSPLLILKRISQCSSNNVHKMSIPHNKEKEYSLNIKNLIEWLEAHGAVIMPIGVYNPKKNGDEGTSVKEEQSYRGLVADHDIKKGQMVARIPFVNAIEFEDIKKSKYISNIQEQYPHMLGYRNYIMSIFHRDEMLKGKKSFYNTYFNSLPESYNNLPLDYSAKEQSILKNTNLYENIRLETNECHAIYRELRQKVPNFDDKFQGYQNFVDSFLAVFTRIAGFQDISKPRNKYQDISFQAPQFDGLNCSLEPRTNGLNYVMNFKDKEIILLANKDISKGTELTTSYGDRDDLNLIHHGFVLDTKDFVDSLNIEFKTTEEDKFLEHKLGIFGGLKQGLQNNLFTFNKKINYFLNNLETQQNFSLLRILSVDNNDDLFEMKKRSNTQGKLPVLSVHNELRTLNLFKDNLLRQRNKFDSTLEQDSELLITEKQNYNETNGIKWRMKEKKTLNYFIRFCDTIIQFYENDDQKKYDKPYREFENYFNYLT